jgi:transcriptional regulator with XRE-family HTH domain
MYTESDTAPRRRELKSFLTQRRKKLRAEDFGFTLGLRRKRGLSQADIAELSGVSLNWYELFESGRGDRHVSVDFVERIAQVLRLDFEDRLELFRLALPEGRALDQIRERAETVALAILRAVPLLVRNVMSAADLHETLRVSADAMQTALSPDLATVATVQERDRPRGLAVGPGSRFVSDAVHRACWDTYFDLPRGHVAIKEISDENGGILGARSSMAVALRRGEAPFGLLGVFWASPRTFSRVEQEMLLAVAAIDEILFSKFEHS